MHPPTPTDITATIAAQLDCPAADIADDDNLIELGLNSIAMMALAGGWRKQGIAVTFAQLAAEPTVAAWAQLVQAAAPMPADPASTPQDPAGTDGEPPTEDTPFALAPMQHAYWIGRADEQQLGGVAAHLYVEFDGPAIDPDRLREAVTELLAMHPMLRTRFLPDGTQQTLSAVDAAPLHTLDLRGTEPDTVAATLSELRDRKTHQRLDVEHGQVIDVTLTRLDEQTSRLHLDVDMLAADAMSYRTLVAELAALYRGQKLTAPSYTYRQYRTEHAADPAVGESDRQWWHQRLPALPAAPELPSTAAFGTRRTVRHAHWLSPEHKHRLTAAAHARAITPAMAVAAVFADTLGGWSRQPHFLLNIPLFQREPVHPEIDRVIGDFTSSVLLDVDVSDDVAVVDRARELQRRLYEGAAHGGYTGLDVLRDLGRYRGEPVLAPIVFTSALDLGELFADVVAETFGEPVWIVSQGPQVLLDAQVTEVNGGLLLNWDVRAEMFPDGVIEAMFAHFTDAVERLAAGEAGWQAEAAARLPAAQANARAAVNATDLPVSGRCLHEGFFDHAGAHPEAPAVLWGAAPRSDRWSYGELARAALAVAGTLAGRGVRPGDTVAVHLPKGPDQVLAVLGVLAAGATYVPIGVDQPPARREAILATAEAVAVITADGAAEFGHDIAVVEIAAAATHPDPLPAPILPDPDSVAYVIFTSGSTGTPKGVEGRHSGAMNTIDTLNTWFAVTAADRTLALSALEFDLSIYDIFGMLSAGGAVVVLDADQRAATTSWVDVLATHRVSVLNCVPSLLDMILNLDDQRVGRSLRAVILGGDWVPADLARRLADQVPGCRFAGLGGSTEASIHNTICEVSGQPPASWTTVPFGVPLPNTRCRVVSPTGRDCPDWVTGELWVGGVNVAAGYRNDPERTAQRFVDHDGMRWYRTGDLARYWPDGTVEFLGRADNQVQLRGHRVELGEVEHALRAAPGVRQAVAVVLTGAAPQLVAVVAGDTARIDADTVSAVAADRLPAYMVPSRVVVLPQIPLTPNGKHDRRALTASVTPEHHSTGGADPRTDVEAALAAITAEVLEVDSIGVDRDFFALGGDSVLATTLIARVRDWLDIDHAVVADLFATRTVAGLARRLAERDAQRAAPGRLGEIARLYLEVAALSDEEVMAGR